MLPFYAQRYFQNMMTVCHDIPLLGKIELLNFSWCFYFCITEWSANIHQFHLCAAGNMFLKFFIQPS